MFIRDISEYFLQKNDIISCVTGVTAMTGTSSVTQDRRSDVPELFGNTVEEAETGSKSKCSLVAVSHIQDFMNASKHRPIKWEDLTYDNMNQYFWDYFDTCMVKYANNKTKLELADDNSSATKKSVRSR